MLLKNTVTWNSFRKVAGSGLGALNFHKRDKTILYVYWLKLLKPCFRTLNSHDTIPVTPLQEILSKWSIWTAFIKFGNICQFLRQKTCEYLAKFKRRWMNIPLYCSIHLPPRKNGTYASVCVLWCQTVYVDKYISRYTTQPCKN